MTSAAAAQAIAQVRAWLNRLALSLLKQHPSRKSIVGKRRGCGWNDAYLLQVLTGEEPSSNRV